MLNRQRYSLLILAALLFCLLPSAAMAATVTWIGGNGLWSNTTSWDTGSVPTAGDDVIIPASAADIVEVQNASVTVSSITVGAGSTLLIKGDSLDGPSSVTATNGATNNGTLQFSGDSVGSATLAVSSGVILNLPGAMITDSGSPMNVNFINGNVDNQGAITVSKGITINKTSGFHTSSGTISIASGASLNVQNGTLINFAGGVLNGSGTLYTYNPSSFVNHGIIRPGGAGAAGTLSVYGDFTQNLGVLEVELFSPFSFDQFYAGDQTSSYIINGTLKLITFYSPALNATFLVVNPGAGFFSPDPAMIEYFPALGGGLNWQTTQSSSGVTVMVVSDSTNPAVLSTSVQTDVGITDPITVTFDKAMDPATINTTTFLVNGTTGSVSYDYATRSAKFTPTPAFASNATQTATITTGAKDLAGNGLAADYQWSFTTRNEHLLTVVNTDMNGGLITAGCGDGCVIECGLGNSTCTGTFSDGSIIKADQSAAAGYVFSGWSSPQAICPGGGPCDVTMNQDVTLTVGFCNGSFSLSPASATFNTFSGSSGSLLVTQQTGTACGWTANGNTPMIAVTAGANGSGNGSVDYAVINSGDLLGTLTAAGQKFIVTRSGVAGGLDPAFGSANEFVSYMTGTTDTQTYVTAAALQSDGKIVVAGHIHDSNLGTDYAVVSRFTSTGALDDTFGTGGIVSYASITTPNFANGLAIRQSDDSIVITGYVYDPASGNDVLVSRLTSTGLFDTTFNNSGVVVWNISVEQGNAVAIDPATGKIAVVGTIYNGADNDVLIMRFNADGALDNSFDAPYGYNAIANSALYSYDRGNAVAIQPDGKVLVAGYLADDSYNYSAFTARYNADGTPDAAFGTNSLITIANTDAAGNAIAVQPDGKILVAGHLDNGADLDAMLLRYNSDGTLDTTFNAGGATPGMSLYDSGLNRRDSATALTLRSNGGIVVAGSTSLISGFFTKDDMLVAYYNADGTLDPNYGNLGVVYFNGPGNSNDSAAAVVVQPDKKVVVAGNTYDTQGRGIVMRLLDDVTPPAVVSTAPASGAVNVPVTTPVITATFSEMIDPATIDASTFTVTGLIGSVTYDPATLTATFTPFGSLTYDALYTAMVTTGVKDLAGNPLSTSGNVWTFATELWPTYTITATAGPNGSISPSGSVIVTTYSAQTFSITPNAGYSVQDVAADFVSQGAVTSYTFLNVIAGHSITASFADITPPLGTIAINGGAPYTNNQAVTLALTCLDAGSGCSQMQFSNEGGAYSAPVSFATTTTWTLSPGDGVKTVSVQFMDNAGNWSGAYSATLTLDTTSPALTVTTLADGSYTNNNTLNITGTVSDINGVQSLVISGQSVTVTGGSYSYAVPLTTGPNVISAIATDMAGNQATDTRTIILDQTLPNLTVTAPSDNSVTNNANITIDGATDKPTTVLITLNSGPSVTAAINATSFSAPVSLATDTVNTITVTATDLAGNTTSALRTVTHDSTNPALAVTYPSQAITTNQPGITITGTVSDQTTVTVTVSDGTNTFTPTVTGGSFSQAITFTTEQLYPVAVTAMDQAGNTSTVVRNIIYDITSPAVTINPVTTLTNVNSQTITGTKEADAAVAVTSATATAGPVSYPTGTAGTTWQADLILLSEGTNTITATATDLAGNTSSPAAAVIVLDTMAPVITMFGISPVTIEAGASYLDAGATAMDTRDGDLTAGIVTTSTVNAIIPGSYSVAYAVADSAGNSATPVSRTVNVTDTFPPAISINPVTSPTSVSNQIISGQVEPGAAVVVSCPTATVGPVQYTGSTWTVDISLVYQGTNTITAVASDLSGNTAAVTATIVFTPAHTIFSAAGPNGTITPSGTLTVNYGGNAYFTITPGLGYRVDDVFVDGVSVGRVESYTFMNVIADWDIYAVFAPDTVSVISSVVPPQDAFINTATVGYALSRDIANGSVTFDRTGGAFDTSHAYLLTAADTTAGSHSINTGLPLIDGAVYTITVTASDGVNTVTAIVNNVTFGAQSIMITNTRPARKAVVADATLGYTLNMNARTGKVTFTRSGGDEDPGSPHVYTFTTGDMTAGTHTVATALPLVDEAFYTVSFEATDLAGNPAATVSNALVFYDSGYGKRPAGKVANDGTNVVNDNDVIKMKSYMGTRPGDPGWNPACDLDKNNTIDQRDLMILMQHYGQ